MADNMVQWSFLRLGGMDQLTLRTAEELRQIGKLDPKLWAALSCPASGLEFHAKTLALLDADGDERIRIPEVVAAVEWLCERVKDPAKIAANPYSLPLDEITDSEAGHRLLATAASIAKDASELTPDVMATAVAGVAGNILNGDGIFPPQEDLDPKLAAYVTLGLKIVGGVTDASGELGLDMEHIKSLQDILASQRAWRQSVKDSAQPAGTETAKAWELLQGLRDKINDYFLRCRMADFAPQSLNVLNDEESFKEVFKANGFDTTVLAQLPLAPVAAGSDLPLDNKLNPAWAERVTDFFALVTPLLQNKNALSHQNWQDIEAAFAPYGAALAARPLVELEGAMEALDALSDAELDALLAGAEAKTLTAMAEQDLSVPAALADVEELEKLVLYYCHLHRFLMNFVSFYEFYSLSGKADFQSGTFYIDGRSCRLCLPVDDVARHSGLAAHSELCLLYCLCTRKKGEPETRHIMVAMTVGNDSQLFEGRNGVFIDTHGEVWDATVEKIVRKPISLRQAIWSPYLSISRTIGEQISKFASAKNASATNAAVGGMNKMAQPAAAVPAAPAPAPAAPKPPFDMGKNVGIFAAVGIALGAIGTAVGSIANALMSMQWWQFPLLFAGIFLCISGPSMFLAWLKLRKRTLGPVLEASGWAVNTRIPVNLKLGSRLSSLARLPENSTRAYSSELNSGTFGRNLIVFIIIAALAGAGGWYWYKGQQHDLAPQAEKAAENKNNATSGKSAKTDTAKTPAKTDVTEQESAKAPKAEAATQDKTAAPAAKEPATAGAKSEGTNDAASAPPAK